MPGRRPLAVVAASATALAGLAVMGTKQAMADVPPQASVGAWSAPFVDTGAGAPVAAAAAVLPDGRVLYGDGASGARVLTISGAGVSFAPAGGGLEGDGVQLGDGRQLVVGGGDSIAAPMAARTAAGPVPLPGPDALPAGPDTLPAPGGAPVPEAPGAPAVGAGPSQARIFDPVGGADGAGSWEPAGSPVSGRAHPSAVTLPDGKVAVVGGTGPIVGDGVGIPVRSTETFDPTTGRWTQATSGLPGGRSLPPNARVFLAPDGGLFYTGDGQMSAPSPDEALWAQQGVLDLTSGEWRDVGLTIPRSSPATAVLPMRAPYDEMTILRAGGTLLTSPGSYAALPTTDLTTIGADGHVTNRAGPELSSARWFSQATPLPTGEVLLTSGTRNDEALTPGAGLPVRTAELYNPDANRFYTLASTDRSRAYRNSAVLLPNGQVLVGGGSASAPVPSLLPGVTADTTPDRSFEIFSPPYLYRGPRPYIDNVQAGVAWGENFTVITDDAPTITKVTLMRMPSPQHVTDSDVRTLVLPFTQTGDRSLAVDMPADGVAAPPGYYYLFISRAVEGNDKLFVPSVARAVRVGPKVDRAEALEPMGEDTVVLQHAPEPAPATSGGDPAGPLAPVEPPAADGVPAPVPPAELPVGDLPVAAPGAAGRRRLSSRRR